VKLVATMLAVAAVGAPPANTAGHQAADPPSACAPPPPTVQFSGVSERKNDERFMPPWTGELRMAMLFVEFPDAPGRFSPEALAAAYMPPVSRWVESVSYGRLRLVVTPFARWLRLARTSSEYASNLEAAAADAVAAADERFDFAGFDAIYVVLARDAAIFAGVGLLGPKPIHVDGTELRAVAWLMADDLHPAQSAYVIHETGHVLGLPDLAVPGSPETFNWWDALATGGTTGGTGGLYAWHRWKLDWLDDRQIVCLRRRGRVEARVTPLERAGGVKAVVARLGSTAYVAEVRQPIGEDAGICKKGVLVYAVDLRTPAQGGPIRGQIRVVPARPNDRSPPRPCGGRWNATFDLGRGEVSRVDIGAVRFRLLAALPDGSYRIRLTRRR
jgi:M6 family metalloprotease-like protein